MAARPTPAEVDGSGIPLDGLPAEAQFRFGRVPGHRLHGQRHQVISRRRSGQHPGARRTAPGDFVARESMKFEGLPGQRAIVSRRNGIHLRPQQLHDGVERLALGLDFG